MDTTLRSPGELRPSSISSKSSISTEVQVININICFKFQLFNYHRSIAPQITIRLFSDFFVQEVPEARKLKI